jgi:hypothetical protein
MAMLAGAISENQLEGIDCSRCRAQVIRTMCFWNPLAANFNSRDYSNVLGPFHDGIVPLNSAVNGQSNNPFNTFSAVHSAGALSLDFLGPHLQEAASGTPDRVIQLLNMPVTAQAFR